MPLDQYKIQVCYHERDPTFALFRFSPDDKSEYDEKNRAVARFIKDTGITKALIDLRGYDDCRAEGDGVNLADKLSFLGIEFRWIVPKSERDFTMAGSLRSYMSRVDSIEEAYNGLTK